MLIHVIIQWVVSIGLIGILGFVMWVLFERVRNVFKGPMPNQNTNRTNQSPPEKKQGPQDIDDIPQVVSQQYRGEEPNLEEEEQLRKQIEYF